MLPDYETIKQEKAPHKGVTVLQFIAALVFIQTLLFLMPTLFTNANTETADTEHVRFRIVANSNSTEDQQFKKAVLQEIQPLLLPTTTKLGATQNLEQVEQQIQQKLSTKYEEASIQVARKQELFPPKRYEGSIYAQDYYEAIVVTIGNGRGDNWWCTLFPKVCYRDEEPKEDEEKKFFIWEWLKGIFA